MVATAATNGINALFVPVRAQGSGFDPVADTIAAAHDRGMRVHAWLNVNLAASASELPAARDHVIYQHPEWLMVPRELAPRPAGRSTRAAPSTSAAWRGGRGRTPSVSRGCTSRPCTLACTCSWPPPSRTSSRVTRWTVSTSITFVSPARTSTTAAPPWMRSAPRSAAALAAAERARIDAVETIDPFAYPEELREEWRLFRQTQVTALVTRLRSTAKAVRAGVVVSATVVPDAALAARDAFQDWRTWVDNGFIDALCPAWDSALTSQSAALIADVRALAGSKPVWIRN